VEREGREKGEGKGEEGREWRVKTCCPMSNKLSPPMVVTGTLRRTNYTTRFYCAVINSLLFLVSRHSWRAICANGVSLESSLNGGRESVEVGWISDLMIIKLYLVLFTSNDADKYLCRKIYNEHHCIHECLTTLPLAVFTQRNFVADFLQTKCDFIYGNRPFCVFETPFGGLRGNVRRSS